MRKTLIDQSFDCWINNYPESFHPCDTERFYEFVKTVLRDGRNIKKHDCWWLRNKIENTKKFIDVKNIDHFIDLFQTLKDFYFSRPLGRERY